MRLHEAIDQMSQTTRIFRKGWMHGNTLARSVMLDAPLVELDFYSLQMKDYTFSYHDLISNDWELIG